MQITNIAIDKLNPATYNPRLDLKPEDKEYQDIKRSIVEFGLVEPLVINKGNIIVGGHQRYKVLKELNFTTVPCITVDLDKQKEKMLNISLNKISGDWDRIKLKDILEELDRGEFDITLTGWGEQEIEDLMTEFHVEPEEDDFDVDGAVEEIKEPICKRGDIWQLGDHRLMCGDATVEEDVKKLMDGKKADMVFTSPPYWVGFEYENEKDKESILTHIDKSCYLLTKISRRIIINTGNISSITKAEKITGRKQTALLIDWWLNAMNKNNFLLRHIRIWAKMGGVMPSRKSDKIDMHWEYLANFTTEDETAGFLATFYDANTKAEQNSKTPTWAVKGIWTDIQGKARGSGHVASFPIVLPGRYIRMYSKKNDLISDFYGGSGTTLIACEQLNRKCYMSEIDPIYIQVILERYIKYKGTSDDVFLLKDDKRIPYKEIF